MHVGELAQGTRFGRYTIERVVGRGGMGVVYTAREDGLNRVVALKVIAPELAQDEAFRTRFLREGRLAAGLEHPNVVPVFSADEVDGHPYIAMRYVPGTDLKTLIATVGRLDPDRALAIFLPLADALDAAHDLGLVHRDVKPANILVGPDGRDGLPRVYLTDLGLTRETTGSRLTQQGMLVGTVEYMAPEQIEGRTLDGTADQYALAASLYEALTGRLPFDAPSLTALLVAKLRDLPPLPSSLRPELGTEFDRIAERAMALAPDARFASCTAFVRAARRALPESIEPAPVSGRTVIEPLPADTIPPVERDADTAEREVPEAVDREATTKERAAPVPPGDDLGADDVVPELPEPELADVPVAEPVIPAAASAQTRVSDGEPAVDQDAPSDVEEAESPVAADGAGADAPAADPEPGRDDSPADADAGPIVGGTVVAESADGEPPPAGEVAVDGEEEQPVGGTIVEPATAGGAAATSEPGTVVDADAAAPTTAAGQTPDAGKASRAARTRVATSTERDPARAPAPAEPRGPARRDEPPARGRSRRPLLIGAGIAAVAVIGVGTALAIGGGSGGATTDAAGTLPTTSAIAPTTSAVSATAGTTTGAPTASTAQTSTSAQPGPVGAATVTDHPKDGWAPTKPADVIKFGRQPQDGVVQYSFPAIRQQFKLAVHGDDLAIDIRYDDPRSDLTRAWVRWNGNRLVDACVRVRATSRTRCGTTAAALGVSPASFQANLLDTRAGYFDDLTRVPALKSLTSGGRVTDVAVDPSIRFPVACATRPAKQVTLCVQENGFVTQLRFGSNRITATSVRPQVSAADLRSPL